ncbi:hypothetical protein TrST_g4906 [Triparma strigata]|uniref:Uncharacterized protein n=1 Tax=Triparma strigata TaxID=1606541 RepID=A0A9W7B4I8_9STRA|nr:hypothetical protein TrST_g4906 [Triparma strigata]
MISSTLLSLLLLSHITRPTASQSVTTLPSTDEEEYSTLSTAFDSVLPQEVFNEVKKECDRFNSLGDVYNLGDMKFGKKSTNWLAMSEGVESAEPRNFIEYAIHQFYELAIPEHFYGDNYNIKHYDKLTRYSKSDIQGAEWWIQARSGKEGIGFHYDKDEAYASNYMTMSFPIISTITYLTDAGAPTLILNQTSLDGSQEFPEVPHEGFLSYPKANRHVLFRGDLNHGVSKTLSLDEDQPNSRVTLLVNWWTKKPMEPNCMVFTDEIAKKSGFVYPDKVAKVVETSKSVGPNKVNSETTPFLNITDPKNKNTKMYTRHMERFPPNDGFHYDMPKPKDLIAHTLYAINWSWNHVFGTVGMLDLWNQNQISSLFRIAEPKLIVFIHDDRDLEGTFGINWWLQPLAKKYQDRVKTYTATKEKASNAWGEFGIIESDLPIAVMHDTKTNRKLVLERGSVFGEDKVEELMKKFLGESSSDEL